MTFEEWYSLEDTELEDNAPSTYDFDSHHKYWLKAAFDAGRKQALEEVKHCILNQVNRIDEDNFEAGVAYSLDSIKDLK